MSKYMDFLAAEAGDLDPGSTEPTSTDFVPNIVVMPDRQSADRWRALWAYNSSNGHEEFTGTKAAAIDWSRARCDQILIWSAAEDDLVLLRHEQ